jgi:hypothetical protein
MLDVLMVHGKEEDSLSVPMEEDISVLSDLYNKMKHSLIKDK